MRAATAATSACAPPLLLLLLLLDQLIEILRQLAYPPLQRRDPLARVLEILARDQPCGLQRLLLRLVERLLRALQASDRRRDRLGPLRVLEELAHRLHAELGGALAERLRRHAQAVYTNSVGTARIASSPAPLCRPACFTSRCRSPCRRTLRSRIARSGSGLRPPIVCCSSARQSGYGAQAM